MYIGGKFMFYNVLKAKDLVSLDGEKFKKEVLLQNDNSCFDLIALKKDEIIDTHTALADAGVYVIEGEIEMHFDAEKFTVEKGELLLFKKDAQHHVLAKKDSKFLLVKI